MNSKLKRCHPMREINCDGNSILRNRSSRKIGCRDSGVRIPRLYGLRFFLFFAAIVSGLLISRPRVGRADKVAALISRLENNSSYRVRVTAALLLGKACDPRAYEALAKAVQSDENPVVRSTAAGSLAAMGLMKAVKVLKKATRDKDRVAKKGARSAVARLCKGDTKGKQVYLNLDRMTYKGPKKGRVAVDMVRCRLAKAFRKESGVLLSWTGCTKPKQRQLSRKRLKGYFVDVVVHIKMFGDQLGCKVSPTIFTYPRGQLRTTGGGTSVKVHGKLDNATIDTCVKHAIDATAGGLIQTIRRL